MRRIVVVDDEPVHNLLLGLILEQAGYETIACESGAQALAEVRRGCDCLITDYHMPGMNGAQLIRGVHMLGAPVCIVLTGSDGVRVQEDAMSAGAVAVLRKPTPPNVILALIEGILNDDHGSASRIGRQPADHKQPISSRRAAGLY